MLLVLAKIKKVTSLLQTMEDTRFSSILKKLARCLFFVEFVAKVESLMDLDLKLAFSLLGWVSPKMVI